MEVRQYQPLVEERSWMWGVHRPFEGSEPVDGASRPEHAPARGPARAQRLAAPAEPRLLAAAAPVGRRVTWQPLAPAALVEAAPTAGLEWRTAGGSPAIEKHR